MVINLDNLVIVDIKKLQQNILAIKTQTNKQIISVIKSDAYGLNVKYLAKYLISAGVNFFAVNKESEYISLNKPLLIMNSVTSLIDDEHVRYSINSYDDLQFLKSSKRKIIVHLQIDTGMNRVGIRSIEEYLKILQEIKECQNIEIEGIYTHFSSNEEEYSYYNRQYLCFLEYLQYYDFPIIHTAGSASLHKKIIGNYVRIGISMYGLCRNLELLPVIRIMTYVINSFYLSIEERFSYGQNTLEDGGYLNIIPLGYYETNDFSFVYMIKNEKNQLKYQKFEVVGKSCMNHRQIKSNFKIKKLTYLYVLLKNGKIYYDMYRFLISLKNIKKIYLEVVPNDITEILKQTNKKGFILRKRAYRNKIITSRVVR